MWERRRRSVLQDARANGDWMTKPPGHSITGAGKEEAMRKGGGEEARSVRYTCDVFTAQPMPTGLPSALMRRAAAFAKMRSTVPLNPD